MTEDTITTAFEFEGWAILELMGHRKLGGYVRLNGPLIRIDVHDETRQLATQWYGAHALYCLTPTTDAVAKLLTKSNRPAPVTPYELAPPTNIDFRDDPFDGDDEP